MRTTSHGIGWLTIPLMLWCLVGAHPPLAQASLGSSFEDCAPTAASIVLAELRRNRGSLQYVIVRTLRGSPPATGVIPAPAPPSGEGRQYYFLLDARGRPLDAEVDDGCSYVTEVDHGRVQSPEFPSGSATLAEFEERLLHPRKWEQKMRAALTLCMRQPQAPCPGLPSATRLEVEMEYVQHSLQTALDAALRGCGFQRGNLDVRAPLLPSGEIQGVQVRGWDAAWDDPQSGPTCVTQALERLRFRPYAGHTLMYPLFVHRAAGSRNRPPRRAPPHPEK